MEKEPKIRTLKHYEDKTKKDPYGIWFSWLRSKNVKTAVIVDQHVQRMGQGNFGDSGMAGDGVRELKIHYGPGFRVYYRVLGDTIILLLLGGDKRSQSSDIEKAKVNWKDYKVRFMGEKP